MAEESVATEEQTQGSEETTQEAEQPKMVPLADLQKVRERARTAEKELKAYKDAEDERKRGEMSENERLKMDLQKATEQIQTRDVKDAKAKALAKAIDGIGDGWTVEHAQKPADKSLPTLQDMVDDIPYDAKTIEAKIKGLVDSVKRQKAPTRSPIAGTPTNVQAGHAQQSSGLPSPAELLKMANENPEQFQRLMSESTRPMRRPGFQR